MSKDAFLSAMGIEVYRLRPQRGELQESEADSELQESAEQPSITFDHTNTENSQVAATSSIAESNSLADLSLGEVAKIASTCRLCALSKERTNVVFGSGSESADLMFIGEGPGAEEDRQGLPFVGKAGQLLTSMIAALGLNRDEVYICNVVKCRPPQNRDPLPIEAKTCTPYLRRQIELIQPKVIIALGRVSAQLLLDSEIPLGGLRRQTYKFKDTDIDLVVTYHPAYLLRKPTEKAKSWEDLWKVRQILQG